MTVQDVRLITDHVLGTAPLVGVALERSNANRDRALDVADLIHICLLPLPPEKVFTLPGGVPLVMVRLPRGSYQMGSVDPGWSATGGIEEPVHTVTIAHDLYMGKFELTQRQWLAVVGYWPEVAPTGRCSYGEECPADYRAWNDVQIFEREINALGLGGTFRLPSEAEWEYAARGGTQTRYSFGDSNCTPASTGGCDLVSYAWWFGNNTGGPGQPGYGMKAVGLKLPNPFGLHDTIGNVWEWCEDSDFISYEGAPSDGSARVSAFSVTRTIRGGPWGARPAYCRSATRGGAYQNGRYEGQGFRIAWTP